MHFLLTVAGVAGYLAIFLSAAAGADRIDKWITPWALLNWWQRGLLIGFWLGYVGLTLGALHLLERGMITSGLGSLFSDDDSEI